MLNRKMRHLLFAAALIPSLTAGAVAVATPASAATRGTCRAAVSSTAVDRGVYSIRWGAASSGWSPAGRLTISAVVTNNGTAILNGSGSDNGTTITLGPFTDERTLGNSVNLRISATVRGPAGTATCSG